MTTVLELSLYRSSQLASACERFDIDMLKMRRLLRWVAELPPDERQAMFAAVRRVKE